MPETKQTRKYNFTASIGLALPYGYQKHVVLISGEFPVPMIEANW